MKVPPSPWGYRALVFCTTFQRKVRATRGRDYRTYVSLCHAFVQEPVQARVYALRLARDAGAGVAASTAWLGRIRRNAAVRLGGGWHDVAR